MLAEGGRIKAPPGGGGLIRGLSKRGLSKRGLPYSGWQPTYLLFSPCYRAGSESPGPMVIIPFSYLRFYVCSWPTCII